MGSNSMRELSPPSDLYIIMDYKYCRVWVRKKDKVEQFEDYTVRVTNKGQFEEYQKMFVLRLNQPYFPTTLYFLHDSTSILCGSLNGGSVLIQRIPYRLCQFANISYQESVSVLFTCFKAYQLLHQSYGLFRVKSTMIGLDQSFSIKVWHHTDLSCPYPEDPYCRTLVQMINIIIRAIENVSVCPYGIPRFSQYLEIKRIDLYGFQLASKLLQEFTAEYLIKIPTKLNHIQKYLKEAQGFFPNTGRNKALDHSSYMSLSTPEKSKNRSLNKFSFKNNQLIEVEPRNIQQNSPISIYYDVNRKEPGISQANHKDYSLLRIQSDKRKSSVKFPPNFRQTRGRVEPVENLYSHFSEYGLQKGPKSINLGDSNLEAIKKELKKASLDNKGIGHGRAISDFTGVNKQQVKVKPHTPHYDINNTETKSGEGSRSQSLKTFVSAESLSFSVDDELRNRMMSFLRRKKG